MITALQMAYIGAITKYTVAEMQRKNSMNTLSLIWGKLSIRERKQIDETMMSIDPIDWERLLKISKKKPRGLREEQI